MITLTPSEIAHYFRIRAPNIKQSGKEWRGACPIHNGKRPSFAVNPATGESFCHSECNRGWNVFSLEEALSETDSKTAAKEIFELVRPKAKGQNNGATTCGRISNTYQYTDAAGNLLFEVVRYEPKNFRQRRPDGRGGW